MHLPLTVADAPENASEVASTGQAFGGLRSSQLIQSQALRAGAYESHARSVRDLETLSDLHPRLPQLHNSQLKVGDAVDKHGLVALEVTREQQSRWVHRRRGDRGRA